MVPELVESRWYRVECEGGGTLIVLGHVPDAFPHPSSLTSWISRARRIGGGGEFRLVEEATGRVVARRRVPPQTSADGDPGRTSH